MPPADCSRKLAGQPEIEVNSLHGQGIDRVAPGLEVEARAPDKLVEGIRVAGAKRFACAVQWHAEASNTEGCPLSLALFGAFGEATRQRAAERAARPSGVRAA